MPPVSQRRLEAVLEALVAHVEAGAPVPRVARDEAIAITVALHGEMDGGVEARAAQVAALGRTIACARGCDHCCAQVILALEPEAATIATWLAEPANAAVRARFLARFKAWRASGADLIERVTAAAAERDLPALRAASRESTHRDLMCPFNGDGACEIYPVRPNLCRQVHALDTADPCKFEGIGDVLDFVPLTDFLRRVRPLERAMHEALRGDAPEVPLAVRVHALLAERPVGRNEPCPCGSGDKYKRCCGA